MDTMAGAMDITMDIMMDITDSTEVTGPTGITESLSGMADPAMPGGSAVSADVEEGPSWLALGNQDVQP
jgi:hypothetical protein